MIDITLKRFAFRFYALIIVLLLVTVVVWFILSSRTREDISLLITLVGGLVSFFYFIQKQKIEELQLFKQLFTEFNSRYDKLNESLNKIVTEGPLKPLTPEEENTLIDYFNLCAEEFLFYQKGYIYPEVWNAWHNGMSYYLLHKRIKDKWTEEEKSNSYYGLTIKGDYMWIFGYGSLMWDGWEKHFKGIKYEKAKLKNYYRDFNKGSTVNWGTKKAPCPTLGLEEKDGAECIGCAFKFEEKFRKQVEEYLNQREGADFKLTDVDIILSDGLIIQGQASINKHKAESYIKDLSLEVRAKMVKVAEGKNGKCWDYIKNLRDHLREIGIEDNHVEEMWETINNVK